MWRAVPELAAIASVPSESPRISWISPLAALSAASAAVAAGGHPIGETPEVPYLVSFEIGVPEGLHRLRREVPPRRWITRRFFPEVNAVLVL